jgi:thiol:disulfide interchange protein
MVADWTRKNPDITALLAEFGFQGVPMVVYYPPQGEPVVLPQLLSEKIIADAISATK